MSVTPSALETKNSGMHWLVAFIAGFFAVLIFHQLVLWALTAAGITQGAPYSIRPVGPFAVPRVLSAAFWGGVWGIVFYFFSRRWRFDSAYWLKALAFGMIFPTLVAWFVVAPLKGLPVVAGGKLNGIVTGLCVNAAWGLGTGILLRLFSRWRGNS
jgi:hypothetical protein